jgi:hypothetical protein
MRADKAWWEYRNSGLMKVLLLLLCLFPLITFLASCGSERVEEPANKPSVGTQTAQVPETSGKTLVKTDTPPGTAGTDTLPSLPATGSQSAGSRVLTAMDIKSLVFSPERPVAGEPIELKLAFNNGEGVEVPLRYRWEVNNETVQESESNRLTYKTKRGDQIEVAVFVGTAYEETRARRATVVVENSPPVIKKVAERLSPNGEYVARLEATDPDGDTVTVKLQRGPTGMTLDGGSNELRWIVPEGASGGFQVEVMASDPAGANVVFSYEITVRQVKESAGSAANATTVSSPPR